MEKTYPQEQIGTTLLDVTSNEEHRRVYLRQKNGYLEIGEFTRGPLTQEIYNAPVHVHCIHLDDVTLQDDAREFFTKEEPLLSDYMDRLDARGIAYGYLNSMVGSHVSYRPATMSPRPFS